MNKRGKATLILSLIVVILLILAGVLIFLTFQQKTNIETLSQEELKEKITQANLETKYYEIETRQRTYSEATYLGEKYTIESISEISGYVNKENEEILVEGTITQIIGNEKQINDIKLEIKDSRIYMAIGGEKMELPMGEINWDEWDELASDNLLIENSKLTIIGEETIKGHDCYIIEIIPDKKKLIESNSELSQQSYIPINELMENLEKYEIKYWIDKKTFQNIKNTAYLPVNTPEFKMEIETESIISY